MKITIPTKTLLDALNTVGIAASGHTTLPILSSIRIDAEKGFLTLSATDLDLFITKTVEATVAKDGSTVVAFSILSRFLARATASEVGLKLADKILEVVAGEATANLETLPVDDFPPNLAIEKGSVTECAAGDILTPISMVAHAMGDDQTRYVLMGVNINTTKKGTEFAATNGQRMAVYRSGLQTKGLNAVLPDKAVRAILKIIKGDSVKLGFTEAAFSIVSGDVEIRGRLIEGVFPNYNQVIPKSGEKVFSTLREELLESITTAALFLRDNDTAVQVTGKGKEIEVACQERFRIKIMGTELAGQPDMTVRFNHKYVRDVLGAMREENVRIECQKDHGAMLFREGSFVGVVMPLKTA